MAAPFPSPTSTWHNTTYKSLSPTRPELSARGKAVLITGGGTGIGGETARYFAQAGASRICLLGRRVQPLLDTKTWIEQQFEGTEVFVLSTDVTKRDQVEAAFAKFAEDAKIDVLVSCAALIGPQASINDVDSDNFLEAIHQNIQGSLYVAQAFVRYSSTDAVAIEVNSGAAHLNFSSLLSCYSISKIAVFRLWDALAFVNPKLSVFHVQPGVVASAMEKEAGGIDSLGHEDHVSLPASFHVWLTSPEARFLRGKFVWANWDVDELKARAKEIETSTKFNIDLVGWPFQDAAEQPTWVS